MNGAIYEQLSEITKQHIKEQVAHFENFEDEKFQHMLRGAELLLVLINDDEICKTGTRNWLLGLTKDQLEYALEEGAKIMKDKKSLGGVMLHGVFSSASSAKWFREKDDAKKFFIDQASKACEDSYPEITMEKRMVPLEEVDEYF